MRATWIEERNQWKLELKDLSKNNNGGRSNLSSEVEVVYFDVLYVEKLATSLSNFEKLKPLLCNLFIFRFCGVGGLRVPNIPPEFKAFKGQMVHTAKWESSINFKDKRVALIGSGSR